MIQNHIAQYLSQGQRGPQIKAPFWELFNVIRFRLKTNYQWKRFPTKAMVIREGTSYKTALYLFCKWVNDRSWERTQQSFIRACKYLLDFLIAQFDGTHSFANRR